jgi:hypothetical protein
LTTATPTFNYSLNQNSSCICDYCLILKPGYILKFTTFEQYQRHVIKNRSGWSVIPTKEELKTFRQNTPTYEVKLRRNIRRELWHLPSHYSEEDINEYLYYITSNQIINNRNGHETKYQKKLREHKEHQERLNQWASQLRE